MYKINYQLNDKILNELIRLEVLKTQIKDMDITGKDKLEMLDKSKSTNMFHLAHMIGVDLTLKDAAKAVEGKRVVTQDARGIILNNFKNAMEFNRADANDNYTDLDVNILLHLNRLLLNEWREVWDAKFRIGGENNETLLDNWLEIIDHEIQPSYIQEELTSVIDWYKSTNNKVHILIRVAVLVYALARIAPFSVLNKITTIALLDYLLFKAGYSRDAYLPSVRNFDINDSEYLEAWNNAINNDNNVTLWIERFISNLANDFEFMQEDMEKILHQDIRSSKQPFLDLNKRQLKILRYLQTIPTVKREDYVQMMDVSTMTAFRDLDDLVRKKLLKIEGKGRGTKYLLTSR
jgi:Fic family protein